VGLKLIFLIAARAVSLLGLSRRGGVVEGRRDPGGDAADCRSWHDRALAPGHRPPPPVAPVAPGPLPLRSQAQGILALDFFTADLLNGSKVYVLAAIEHGTRRIRILGATEHPVQSWVAQQARNLLMDLEEAGTRAKFVLHDRDASFTAAFDAVFQAAGAIHWLSLGDPAHDHELGDHWRHESASDAR
jgi:hypothetical protein